MSFKSDALDRGFENSSRNSKNATSITTSQRSSCAATIYRWDNNDITKIQNFNIANEKGIAGKGQASARGNLGTKGTVTIRNDIIRCNISKNKGQSSGSFSLTLKRGKKITDNKVQPENVNYLETIHPGDWIMLYMKKSGKISDEDLFSTTPESGLKFIGVIENVRYVEVDDPAVGRPRLEYIITGRDFGKVFDMNVFFNPQLSTGTLSTILGAKYLSDASGTLNQKQRANLDSQTPDRIISELVDFYLGGALDKLNSTNQTWYVPRSLANTLYPDTRFNKKELNQLKNSGGKVKNEGVSFVDILDTFKIGHIQYNNGNVVVNPRTKTIKNILLGSALVKSLPSTGNVWAILDFLKNSAVNEIFTELTRELDPKTGKFTGKLVPSLVHRQMPFSNNPAHETSPFKVSKDSGFPQKVTGVQKNLFVDIPRHEIVSSDVKQKNVGKTDFERINHAIVVPKIDSTTFEQLYAVSINAASVQRYGLKSFQAQTSYILNSKLGIKKACDIFLNLIVDWFFLAHQYYNGTIVVDGFNEHIEIGNNLYIKDVKQLYHIEGYNHNYQIMASGNRQYNTEVRVSRGQSVGNDNIAKFISESSEPVTITTSVIERGGNE